MDAILKFLTELRKGLKVVDAFTREPAELAVERTYLDLAAQRLKRPWDQARRNGFLESPLGGQLSRNIDAALRQAELLSSQSNLGNPVVRLLYLWWKESCPAADRQRKAIAATHTLIEQRKEELALCFATLYHTFRENKEKVDTWLAQMKQQQEEQAQILSDEDDRVDYLMKTVSQFFGEMCEEFGGTVEVKIREEGEDSWHPREVYLRVPNFQPIQLEMTWTGQFYFYIFESRQAWQGKTDSRIVRLEYPRSGSDNNFAPSDGAYSKPRKRQKCSTSERRVPFVEEDGDSEGLTHQAQSPSQSQGRFGGQAHEGLGYPNTRLFPRPYRQDGIDAYALELQPGCPVPSLMTLYVCLSQDTCPYLFNGLAHPGDNQEMAVATWIIQQVLARRAIIKHFDACIT